MVRLRRGADSLVERHRMTIDDATNTRARLGRSIAVRLIAWRALLRRLKLPLSAVDDRP